MRPTRGRRSLINDDDAGDQQVARQLAGAQHAVSVAERIDAERRAAANRKSLPWVLERRSDGLVLGWLRIVRQASDPSLGEIGYWLGLGFQGHGYMAEALPAVARQST